MRVRVFNSGESAYMTTVTDAETGVQLLHVTDVDLHISARDPYPYALLTISRPCIDVTVDAEIKYACPCCRRDWNTMTQ